MLRNGLPSGEERRDLTLSVAAPEIRVGSDTERPRFYGHAAVFNTRTAIGNPLTWGFYEQVAPGAFTKTLSEGDARFLIDHDSYYIVARKSAGSLLLSQDDIGLVVDSSLDVELSYVRDLTANLRNGNLTGMSFGFRVTKDDWTEEPAKNAAGEDMVDADGNAVMVEVRTIREVQLYEVSAVTFPAYEETDAGLRHSLVPALRRRDDRSAIERVIRHKPELAGELLGIDTPIAPTGMQLKPFEESDREPAESTRPATDDSIEPAASTRHAPSEHALAKAHLLALKRTLRPLAA